MYAPTLGLLGLIALAAAGTLITNGDFEQGGANWSLSHDWYAKPQGGGLSQMAVVEGEGRGGSKCLRIVGDGKRGIAMQVFPVNPGKYRVTGWMKCENLTTQAKILCEWIGRGGTWMSCVEAGAVTGTQDWTHFDTVVEAPAGARSVHFDLLTSEPNNGIAWFDDVTMAREKSGFPTPQPPKISAETPPGQEGCLLVTCDPKGLTAGALQLLVYCEEKPLAQVKTPLPVGVVDMDEGKAMIQSLEVGKTYHVAAQVINGDGEASALGPEVTVKVLDRQPPRAGWLYAERTPQGVRASWSPHALDADVRRVTFCLPDGDKPGRILKMVEVASLYDESRPFYQTQPWLTTNLQVANVARISVLSEDKLGNKSIMSTAEIADAAPDAALPCTVGARPPTDALPRNVGPIAQDVDTFALTLMPGQAKGYQIVLYPQQPLHNVRVLFEAPLHEDGNTRIDTRWLAYHFVDYVHLEKNSIATPKEELVWPAPSDFPDELSDDLTRDLVAEGPAPPPPGGAGAQPIYLRLTAPPETKPGKYTGRGWIVSAEGQKEFGFTLKVTPVRLPNPCRLPFVYWFSWGDPCKEFGVDTRSADGWRVLYQVGRLMRAHHERVVVVPWSMVQTWKDKDGKLRHDFRDFDRFIRTFQAAGVDQLFCLSHFGGRTTGAWECPTMRSHGHTVRDLATGQQLPPMDCVDLLPALQNHIEQLGLLKRFCVHVADEPIPVNVESYRQLSARVHKAAPKLPRIDAIHVPDLQGALEIWVPQINYFDQWRDQFRKAQAAGNQVWTYIAWVPQGKFPNRMIDGGAIKPRVLHWLNALDDTDGYLHWALNHWHIPLTSLNSPGDQYICWPSKRFIANSSLRYEAEREGLEDCELLFMVRDKLMKQGLTREQAQAQMEAVGRKAVRNSEDYTRSWQELEDVRAELLGMLK